MADSVGSISLDLELDHSNYDRELKQVNKGTQSSISSLSKGVGKALLGMFAIKGLVDFGKSCLKLGSDLAEVQNVVDVAFGSKGTISRDVNNFAKKAAAGFGLSETMAKRYLGTFGSMSTAFGFSTKEASEMSKTLTGLTGDVASFYNITQDEAYTKLKSVFTGETESLKDLGVVMTQNALDQYALAQGYGKTTAKMTEQEKVALRLSFVQNQLRNASGDFARTQNSWANQTRVLSLQMESLKANVGKLLIDALSPALTVINKLIGRLVKLTETWTGVVSALTGQDNDLSTGVKDTASSLTDASDNAESLSGSIKDAGKEATKTAKKMLGLAGFDELNNLSSSAGTSGTSGTGDSSGPAASTSGESTPITPKVDTSHIDKLDKALSNLKKLWDALKGQFLTGFKIGFGDTSVLSSIKKELASIWNSVKEIATAKEVKAAVGVFMGRVAKAFGMSVGAMASIGATVADNLLGGISKYLETNKNRIKNYLVEMLNIQGQTALIVGRFHAVLADIISVFRSEDAKSITASIIKIFADSYMGVTKLVAKLGRDVVLNLTKPITQNKNKIKTTIQNALKPAAKIFGTLATAVADAWDGINDIYDNDIKPILDTIGDTVSDLFEAMLTAYNKYVIPVWNAFSKDLSEVYTKKVKPAMKDFRELIGKLSPVVMALVSALGDRLKPILTFIIRLVGNQLKTALTVVIKTFSNMAGIISGLSKTFSGLIDVIEGIATGDIKKTWEGLKTTFTGVGKTLKSMILLPLTTLITTLKGGLSFTIKAVIADKLKELMSFVAGLKDKAISIGIKAKEGALDAVKNIKEKLAGVKDKAVSIGVNIKEKAADKIAGIKDKISALKDKVVKLGVNLPSKVLSLIDTFVNRLKNVKNMFDKIKDKTISAIFNDKFTAPFKKAWNVIASKINSGIETLNKVPGVNIKARLPKLAKGGYVKANTPQLAVIGDNRHQGEVVAPEDKLAEIVSGAVAKSGTVTAQALVPVIERLCVAIGQLESRENITLEGVSNNGLYRIVKQEENKQARRGGVVYGI